MRRVAVFALVLVAASAALGMGPLDDVPVPASFDTTAIASGPWDDSNTWSGGVPADGDYVNIPKGFTVTLSGPTERIEWIQVVGTLALSPISDSTLYVETIVVYPKGELQLTSLPATNLARVVFISTPQSLLPDPKTITRGLIAAGEVHIKGAVKTHMREVIADVPAGSSSITLDAAPTGWNVGDDVVLTGTYFRRGKELQDERFAIQSIDGNTVHIAGTFTKNHLRVTSGGTIPPMHVVNLTRNVRFESESTASSSDRGHVMLMHADSSLENVALINLGRTDKSIPLNDFVVESAGLVTGPGTNRRGRYALHVHMTRMNAASGQGPGTPVTGLPPTVVTGCVVDRTTGWGFVNHSSHVDFRRNVAYGFTGAGFVTEAGDELGNFIDNVAIHGIGQVDDEGETVYYKGRLNFENPTRPHPLGDIAFSGVGFWFSGPALHVRNLVANSCNGDGVIWHTTGTVDVTKADSTAPFGRYTPFPEEWIHEIYGTRIPEDFSARHWEGGDGRLIAADLPILYCHNIDSYANLIGFRLRFNNHHSGSWYGESKDSTSFEYRDQIIPADGQTDRDFVPKPMEEMIDGTINLWNNEEAASLRYVTHATLDGVNALNRLDYDPINPANNPSIQPADGIESGHKTSDIVWNDPLIDGYELAIATNDDDVDVTGTPLYRNVAVEELSTDPQPCKPLGQKPAATITPGSATITWEVPDDGTRVRYLLRYKHTAEQQWHFLTITDAAASTATLTGLSAENRYWVQVICGCTGGTSIWSRPAVFEAE